jgi:DNA invertase Pin-like site-specific DNA recombinase
VERQEALCRKLAAEKGWPVGEVYVDNDLSAFSGRRRPAYEAMLADVECGLRDAVLAVDQDRLVRRVVEIDGLIRLCEKTETAIVLTSGEIDTTSADGVLKAQLLAVVAENESRKKSERLKRQRDQAARLGVPTGGRRAFGYDPDGMTVRHDEAKIVKEIARRALRGESLRKIAIDLNEREIPTCTGARWRVTTVRVLLANPRYAALRVHRGEVIGDATWPAILDRATHEQLRALLGDPRRAQRGRPPAHLLAGLLRCDRCGERMHTSHRKDGARRYVCSPAPGGCGRVAVTAEPLEELIVSAVLHRLDSAAMRRALAKPKKKTRDAGDLDDLRAIEADLDCLAADFGNGAISRREWLAAREPLERRRDAARRAVDTTTDRRLLTPLTGAASVRTAWEKLDLEQQRSVLKVLIDRIVIAPAALLGRRALDPDRVDIVWRA